MSYLVKDGKVYQVLTTDPCATSYYGTIAYKLMHHFQTFHSCRINVAMNLCPWRGKRCTYPGLVFRFPWNHNSGRDFTRSVPVLCNLQEGFTEANLTLLNMPFLNVSFHFSESLSKAEDNNEFKIQEEKLLETLNFWEPGLKINSKLHFITC